MNVSRHWLKRPRRHGRQCAFRVPDRDHAEDCRRRWTLVILRDRVVGKNRHSESPPCPNGSPPALSPNGRRRFSVRVWLPKCPVSSTCPGTSTCSPRRERRCRRCCKRCAGRPIGQSMTLAGRPRVSRTGSCRDRGFPFFPTATEKDKQETRPREFSVGPGDSRKRVSYCAGLQLLKISASRWPGPFAGVLRHRTGERKLCPVVARARHGNTAGRSVGSFRLRLPASASCGSPARHQPAGVWATLHAHPALPECAPRGPRERAQSADGQDPR